MRKAKPKKRVILPDPKFGDLLVTRFVNNLMSSGKKSVALNVFYDAMTTVAEKNKDTEKGPLEIWKKAIENITPQVEVKSRRVGGATFQVPQEVRADRKVALAIKHMIMFSRKRAGKSMSEKLAAEILLLITKKVVPSRKRKTCTRWPMPIKLLLILGFNSL
jgi:small subunit ribosomal protein S7